MKLGYYMIRQRNKLGLYQAEASKQIGISRAYLSAIENDKVFAYDPHTLAKISKWLNKSNLWVLRHVPKKEK